MPARPLLLFIALLVVQSGCTTPALERYTVNQSSSITDLRYRQALQCLADVANDPGTLPSFAVVAFGTTTLSDTAGIDSTTVWDQAVRGFTKQTSALTVKRNPDLTWTVDPITSAPLVEGLRDACLWVILGQPPLQSPEMSLLRAPNHAEYTGYHLSVAEQLACIPHGWLGIGRRKDVPKDACYVAHCGCTYVWVPPEGMAPFSEFALVLIDIATTDPPSVALSQIMVSVETKDDTPDAKNSSEPPKAGKGPKLDANSMTELLPAIQSVAVQDGHLVAGTITINTPTTPADISSKVNFGKVSRDPGIFRPRIFSPYSPALGF